MQNKLAEEKKQNALYRLHLGLRKINRELKLNKYGNKCRDIWFDYLQHQLEKLHIVISSKGNTHRWSMVIAEANLTFCYQDNTYFQRN